MPRVKLNKAEYVEHRFSDMVRGELARQKLKRQDLAAYLGKTPQVIGQKMLGRVPWTLGEMVETLEFLNTSFTIGEGSR
ncbi:MAG: hypothetical protein J6U74_01980 [Clostridia bacterium]|nr:hypothetical protein [Clostridia bacterium]